MSSLAMRDCIVEPYKDFFDKLKVLKKLQKEMLIKHGRNKKYDIIDLDTCLMVEFKSEKLYH